MRPRHLQTISIMQSDRNSFSKFLEPTTNEALLVGKVLIFGKNENFAGSRGRQWVRFV